jgi:hypothetical protein
MRTQIHNIPGKMETSWISEVNAVLDTWTTYVVSLSDFKEAVLVKGLDYARKHKGIAWIVDSSTAHGAFSQEIQAFIGSDVFPSFAKAGIKYFITILPKESAVTKMTVKNYMAKVGPNGLQLVECNSVEDAVEWLKQNK